jgi:hypothetical protein
MRSRFKSFFLVALSLIAVAEGFLLLIYYPPAVSAIEWCSAMASKLKHDDYHDDPSVAISSHFNAHFGECFLVAKYSNSDLLYSLVVTPTVMLGCMTYGTPPNSYYHCYDNRSADSAGAAASSSTYNQLKVYYMTH